MAHPTGTTARVQRLTALVAIVLVAIAVGFAFGRVFIGHGATYRLIAVGVASAIVAWSFERRSLLLATVVSAALLIVAIGLLVFPATMWHGVPTLETLRQMGDAAGKVGEEARIQISPAPTNPSLMLAAITAVWAAVFSCFALAFRAGSPLLSLVPPVALVAFADSVLDQFVKPVYGVLFLIAALAVVFADSLRRIHGWGPVWSPPGARNRLLPSTGRAARRVGAGVVVLAALAPFIVPGFGSKAVINLSSFNSRNRVHISPFVQIGSFLNQQHPVEVFQVQTDQPAYWRMMGLDQLDVNGGWSPRVEAGQPIQPGTPLLTSDQQQTLANSGDTTVNATFTAENDLGFTTLPVAYQASQLLSADAPVTWYPDSQTMSVADWPEAGSTYQVQSVYPTPTASDLRLEPIGTKTQYPGETELPEGLPGELHQIAKQWTKGETNPFDKVMAIEDHLLDNTAYHYDITASYPESPDGILQFLVDQKRGFCEQFASAMAVLLRELQIPARVAMGFTPGEQTGVNIDTYSVDTSDLHAWVEVPFTGYGWLPFDPTPGTRLANPAALTYMTVGGGSVACSTGQHRCDNPGGNGIPKPTPKPSTCPVRGRGTLECNDPIGSHGDITPTTVQTSQTDAPSPLRPWLAWFLVGGAVIVLAGIPLMRQIGRRRKLSHAAREPRALVLATYDVFTERAADLGLGRGPGETPFEYRRRIEATDLLTDGHMQRLTGTVIRAAYSTRPVSDDDALDATADADQVIRDLRRSTSLRRRILGVYRRD